MLRQDGTRKTLFAENYSAGFGLIFEQYGRYSNAVRFYMSSMPRSRPLSASRTPEVTVCGVVVSGHRVASGLAENSPYPSGTIAMQSPHFLALGVDLAPFYPGTLNVSIAPHRFTLIPWRTLHQVKWSPDHAAESFSFVPVHLLWQQQSYSGLIYYPHPETKIDHFQDPAVLELLLPAIASIPTGSPVILTASASELIIES